MSKNFIQKAIKKPGALRKSLGIKKGEKIPAAKLREPLQKRKASLVNVLDLL